jgi:3-(methylthio)propanoyl-CoA dehydrogenase
MSVAARIEATEGELARRTSDACRVMRARLAAARQAFAEVAGWMAATAKADPNAVYAGSVPYLMLAGTTVAGWQMARALIAAEDAAAAGDDLPFMQAKIATARFFAEHLLTRVPGLRDAIVDGGASVTALSLESF